MNSEPLIDAAGLVADGREIDLVSISSSLSSDEERAIADELAVVARIAAAHRKLHQVLPVPADHYDSGRSTWGHLELIEVVGRGSYGTVYRAWDPRLDRLVALKLFHGARNPEAVMREGRMLARIRHENVVTVHGADVFDGTAGIWMEFVHGRRLDQIVEQQGLLRAEEAAVVGVAVCRALAAVHHAGLLHCDVKAQNVIREPAGRIVLMDLGAGRSATPGDDSTAGVQVAGTPRYMAPEVFDEGPALPQSDVYSVGVLLFYLVTGRFPVDGKTLGEIRRAHRERQRVSLVDVCEDLPAAFVREISRAIDPDPQNRHRTPGELEAGLLGTAPALVPAPVPLRPVSRPIRRIAPALVATLSLALLILVAAAIWEWRGPATNAVQAPRAVAVLPIRNLTGDPSKAYLADGLTEVLISNLARLRALRVPSFAAVVGFRDNSEPSASIARKLGVELLLAGSIVESGQRSRVTVQLIDPKLDTVLWGEELTRDSGGLLAAQAEIARLVAAHLALRLSPAEQRALQQSAIAPEAQDAYLRGLAAYQAAIDVTAAKAAVDYFRHAVDLEPNFAAAWAELAVAEIKRIDLTPSLDRQTAAVIPREQAQRAIDLDPTLAEGYVALGTVQFYFDWDFAAAERTFRTGLAQVSSASAANGRLAMLLAALGRTKEAIEVAADAQRLEPLLPARAITLGTAYYYARDYHRAEQEMRRALDLSPGYAVAHFGLGRIYSAVGRHAEAVENIGRALVVARSPGYLAEYARALTVAGRSNEAAAAIAELEQRRANGEGYSIDNMAYVAAANGRIDEAFSILNEAIDLRLVNMLWIAVDPRADPLRNDPRFSALLSRMNLRP